MSDENWMNVRDLAKKYRIFGLNETETEILLEMIHVHKEGQTAISVEDLDIQGKIKVGKKRIYSAIKDLESLRFVRRTLKVSEGKNYYYMINKPKLEDTLEESIFEMERLKEQLEKAIEEAGVYLGRIVLNESYISKEDFIKIVKKFGRMAQTVIIIISKKFRSLKDLADDIDSYLRKGVRFYLILYGDPEYPLKLEEFQKMYQNFKLTRADDKWTKKFSDKRFLVADVL